MASLKKMENGKYRLRYQITFMTGCVDRSRRYQQLSYAEPQLSLIKEIEWKIKICDYSQEDVELWHQRRLINGEDARILQKEFQYHASTKGQRPSSETNIACNDCRLTKKNTDLIHRNRILNEKLTEARKLIMKKDEELQIIRNHISDGKGIESKPIQSISSQNEGQYEPRSCPVIIRRALEEAERGLSNYIDIFPLGLAKYFPVVYFLLYGRKLQRIGESMNLASRMRQYVSGNGFEFDNVFYVPAPEDKNKRRQLERKLIKRLNPPQNRES